MLSELLFLLLVGLWGSINHNWTITPTNFICCSNSLGLSLIWFTYLAFFKLCITEKKDYRLTQHERSQFNLELQTDMVYWASIFKILIRKCPSAILYQTNNLVLTESNPRICLLVNETIISLHINGEFPSLLNSKYFILSEFNLWD